MSVVFLVLLSLALLAAIVVGLRRYQMRESESNADRQAPLPPLDLGAVGAFSDEEYPADAASLDVVTPAVVETTTVPAASPARADGGHWLQECNELKNQGRYLEALAVCEFNFPQWGAFSQACTVLRAHIRSLARSDEPVEPLLQKLYHLAACASFLHDKLPELPALTPRQLRQLPSTVWDSLEMPYDLIGYQELRLLGKSDQKQVRELWGEPSQHLSPRVYHRDTWLRLLEIYADVPRPVQPAR